jgi:hypothetical protein
LSIPRLAVVAAVLLKAGAAAAQPVPQDLQQQFKPFQLRSLTAKDGVVRIEMARSVVKASMFMAAVKAYCMPFHLQAKRPWGGQSFRRLEVMNDLGAQGLAFVGGKTECNELGALGMDAEKAYVAARTWVCVAGQPCRERRPGERTAADD